MIITTLLYYIHVYNYNTYYTNIILLLTYHNIVAAQRINTIILYRRRFTV